MKTNSKKTVKKIANHAGIMVPDQTAEKQLEKIVSCLMLFEDTFYQEGSDMAKQIETLVQKCRIEFVCDLAIKTRKLLKLRHAPLFLMVCALKMKGEDYQRNLIGHAIADVISRADELAEILAIYWKVNGKDASLPRQLKAGIAKAFPKFNEYNLAKYNQDGDVKLRDALFLSHAKPTNKDMRDLWKKLVDNKLETPMTWEVMLSEGKDKKKTFTKLIKDGKLGYMALLKNLRNMQESGVNEEIVEEALMAGAKESMALPYRFVTAARYAPTWKKTLSKAMVACLEGHPKLSGKTAVLIDVSPSMDTVLSAKSEMSRTDAAAAFSILCKEICEKSHIYGFSNACKEVTGNPKGFNLSDAVSKVVPHNGTMIGMSIKTVISEHPEIDRLIIVTDEQSQDKIPNLPKGMKGYIINVAPYAPALPTYDGVYTRFSGFSERVLEWIMAEEQN